MKSTARAIHQIVAAFREGDATGNHALALRDVFRSWGLAAEIFAPNVNPDSQHTCRPLFELPANLGRDDVVVYHHTIYSPATTAFVGIQARRVMIYHNITPARYFAGMSGPHEELTRLGRAWLPRLIEASHLIL